MPAGGAFGVRCALRQRLLLADNLFMRPFRPCGSLRLLPALQLLRQRTVMLLRRGVLLLTRIRHAPVAKRLLALLLNLLLLLRVVKGMLQAGDLLLFTRQRVLMLPSVSLFASCGWPGK